MQKTPGAVAQLGERRLCTPEVAGSIPVSSTIFLVINFPEGFGEFNKKVL
jgi:hypothetical protein